VEFNIQNSLKTVLITPIHKGPILIIIYRSVFQTFFSKTFERIVRKRFLTDLEEYLTLPKSQYSFRENLGTDDALAQLSKDLYTNLEQKEYSWT